VWKLQRALYGLKQAPRQWHLKLSDALDVLGFRPSEYDPSLFLSKTGGVIYITVYVDDLLLVGDDELVRRTALQLNQHFDMSDFGEVSLLLGVDIKRVGHTFVLSQRRYIGDVLKRFGPISRPATTPFPSGVTVVPAADGEVVDGDAITVYRSCVGALLYVALATRPDLSACVGVLARHVSAPSLLHTGLLHHVLEYLYGTAAHQLVIGGASSVEGYCDSDWGGDKGNRRSTYGYCFTLGSGMVSWSSKQQKSVAQSTAEAEYVAASEAVKEGLWLRGLVTEFGIHGHVLLHSDNQAAIAMIHNPVRHSCLKHIDIRFHFVRNEVQCGTVQLQYVRTRENVADILTKPLSAIVMQRCVVGLGLV